MEARINTGVKFAELIWFFVANRIVEKTIRFYELDQERADALRAVYLREADYIVRVRH